MITVLLAWSGSTYAQDAVKNKTYCDDLKTFDTKININLESPPPDMNFSKSLAYLTQNSEKIRHEWAKTSEQRVWMENGHTNGLIRGGFGFQMRANHFAEPYGGYGSNYYCPFFQTINIDFFYGSTIFVAKDFKEGTCDYGVILDHELRHHKTNQELAQKYVERLRGDLPLMIKQIESYGYVTQPRLQSRFDLMSGSLEDAINIYLDAMDRDMSIQNSEIDSLENYKRENMICAEARKLRR